MTPGLSGLFSIPRHFPTVISRHCPSELRVQFFTRRRKPPTNIRYQMGSQWIRGIADASFKVEYNPLDDVENLEQYRAGGFHPISIGDCLNNRYSILHKLGFGTYSTTWLARDQAAGGYVAVKVGVAGNYRTENEILRTLNIEKEMHQGDAFLPLLLDEFALSGPNGHHLCSVTAPAKMDLNMAKDASISRLFQPPVARAIVAQLIQSVNFLHSRGTVHADLHPGNVLLRLPKGIDALSPERLYERFGKPSCEPVERLDGQPLPRGVPSYGVMPVWLGEPSDLVRLSEAEIILTDFGESFSPSISPRYYYNAPRLFAPPEVYFPPDKPISFPADIWTLACTIWSIIGAKPLFEGLNPSSDWVTKEQVDALGKLPPEWWVKWDHRSKWFNEEGERDNGTAGRPLELRFEDSIQQPRREYQMEVFGPEEKASICSMLKSMMAFRPEERTTAEDVLWSDWMRKWALRDLESMKGLA